MSYTPDILVNKEEFEKVRNNDLPKPLTAKEKAIAKVEEETNKEYQKIEKSVQKTNGLSRDERIALIESRFKPFRESRNTRIKQIEDASESQYPDSKKVQEELDLIRGRDFIAGDHNEVNIRGIVYLWLGTEFSSQTYCITAFCDKFNIEHYTSY